MSRQHNIKISIITVCLNSVDTIEQTIRSVLDQPYHDIEYIIIDGGSTDGTTDIIRKYEDRLSYWSSGPDRGIYDAMNKGIDKAEGGVVAFLNSDDWYEPDAIGYAAGQFADSGIYVLSGLLYYWTDGRPTVICQHENDFRLTMACSHQAVFVRRELFEKYGKFNLKYAICADYDWLLKLYNENVPYTYCKKVFTNVRSGGASTRNFYLTCNEAQAVSLSAALDLRESNKIDDKEYCDLVHRINLFRYNLTCRYIGNNAVRETQAVFEGKLKEHLGLIFRKERYALFGCGKMAEWWLVFFRQMGKKVLCFYDNNAQLWGKLRNGIGILPPKEIKKGECEIVITSGIYESDIALQLDNMGLQRNLDYVCFSDLVQMVGAKMYGYL